MKHLSRPLFLSALALFIFSCQKEEIGVASPSSLNIDAISKAAAKPYYGTRIKEIRTNSRSYIISYNKLGKIDSVNAADNFPEGSKYKCIAYYSASRLDSVQLINQGKVESVTTNIKYKGNLVVQTDYWTQRPLQPYPQVRPLYYDNKKRLLNSMTQDRFTYDELGAITKSVDPDYDQFSYSFTVDYKINPLHLIPNFFLVLIEDYNIVEFWYNPYNTTSRINTNGTESIFYHNDYNEKGQLIRKSWNEYGYPKYMVYIYE
jgi:hypothetical protein